MTEKPMDRAEIIDKIQEEIRFLHDAFELIIS